MWLAQLNDTGDGDYSGTYLATRSQHEEGDFVDIALWTLQTTTWVGMHTHMPHALWYKNNDNPGVWY